MLRSVELPPGFHIALYALLPDALAIAVDPTSKDVFVGTGGNTVWELSGNGHGKVSGVAAFAPQSGFDHPGGVCFAADGTMFVVEPDRVMGFDPVDGADAEEHDVVRQRPPVPHGRSAAQVLHACRVGPDDRLYFAGDAI